MLNVDNNNFNKKDIVLCTSTSTRQKPAVTSIIVGQRKISIFIPADKKEGWEQFKKLAQQERCSISELMFTAALEYAQRHYPGNPQLPLTKFSDSRVQIPQVESDVLLPCPRRRWENARRKEVYCDRDCDVKIFQACQRCKDRERYVWLEEVRKR